jgi:ribosomal protein L37E
VGGVYALGVGRLIEAIAASRKKMFAACGLGGESQRKASWMSSITISRAILAIRAGSRCGLARRNSVVQYSWQALSASA